MTSNDASPACKLEFVAEFLANQETGKRSAALGHGTDPRHGELEELSPAQLAYIQDTLAEQQPYLDRIRAAMIAAGILECGEPLTSKMLGVTIPNYLSDLAALDRPATLEMTLVEVASRIGDLPKQSTTTHKSSLERLDQQKIKVPTNDDVAAVVNLVAKGMSASAAAREVAEKSEHNAETLRSSYQRWKKENAKSSM